MDAPKCKTCGKVEWRHVCVGMVAPAVNRKARVRLPALPQVKSGRREAYNAYMRAYMVGWRKRRREAAA